MAELTHLIPVHDQIVHETTGGGCPCGPTLRDTTYFHHPLDRAIHDATQRLLGEASADG